MKKWTKTILWSLLSCGVFMILSIGRNTQDQTTLEYPIITIHDQGENAFLTKTEIYERLKNKGLVFNGQSHSQLKAEKIEQYIAHMSEVKEVKVFTNLGSKWQIDLTIRKPIARIFNTAGESYYLDEDGVIMNTSNVHTARVVVVTGNIHDRISSKNVQEIINNPYLKSIRKIDDVYRISNYVCNDPFLRAMIGQIHLNQQNEFVLIPLVGGQKILFGTAYSDKEVIEKFNKLKIFYKEGVPYEGWNKYETINLKFDKQIVCKTKKGTPEEN